MTLAHVRWADAHLPVIGQDPVSEPTLPSRQMDFRAFLERRFRAAVASDVDLTITLVAGGRRLTTFAVEDGALRFDPVGEADVTFSFDTVERAVAVLGGTESPMDAFMAGAFRADGHLPLAFVLLGMFGSGDVTPPP